MSLQLLLPRGRPSVRARSQRVARAPQPRPGLRRSLRLSVWEGITAEIVGTCSGAAVLTAWALHFKAGPLLFGLIVSLSQVAQWVQFPAAWITSTFGARRTAVIAVAASRQILLPLVFLAFAPCSESTRRAVLIAVAILAALLGVVGNNAWTVWMSDVVPRRVRGRYFGRRAAVCAAANALGALSSGMLLDWSRSRGWEHVALSALALVACIAGACSTWLMVRQGAPRREHEPVPFDLRLVKAPWRDAAARPLLRYQIGWNAAVGLAGSFFTVFMVQELQLGFATIAIHGALTAAARMLAAPRWGRIIDEVGAKPVLIFCSFAISILPLLWVTASRDSMWMIWCDPLLAGVLWGGHAQAIFQLPLTVAPRRERSYYLAAFAMAGGLAFALATSLAGALATRVPSGMTIGGHHLVNYQVLFVLSAVARGAAATLSIHLVEQGGQPIEALWGRLMPRLRPFMALVPGNNRSI